MSELPFTFSDFQLTSAGLAVIPLDAVSGLPMLIGEDFYYFPVFIPCGDQYELFADIVLNKRGKLCLYRAINIGVYVNAQKLLEMNRSCKRYEKAAETDLIDDKIKKIYKNAEQLREIPFRD